MDSCWLELGAIWTRDVISECDQICSAPNFRSAMASLAVAAARGMLFTDDGLYKGHKAGHMNTFSVSFHIAQPSRLGQDCCHVAQDTAARSVAAF